MAVTPNPPHYVWYNSTLDFLKTNFLGIIVGGGAVLIAVWMFAPSQAPVALVPPPQYNSPLASEQPVGLAPAEEQELQHLLRRKGQ